MHREDHTAARRDLGRHLRDLRERKGLRLEDLAEETRIRHEYLDALEQGDYDVFPGEYWARQFLRSYAAALGINAGIATSQAFGSGTEKGARERVSGVLSRRMESAGTTDGPGRNKDEAATGPSTSRDVAKARLRAESRGEPRPRPAPAPAPSSGAPAAPPRTPGPPRVADKSAAGRRGTGRRIASAALPEPSAPARSRRAARRASRGGGWVTGGLTLSAAVVVALVAVTVWPRPVKAPAHATLAPVGRGSITAPGNGGKTAGTGKTTIGTGPSSRSTGQGAKTTAPPKTPKPGTDTRSSTGKGAARGAKGAKGATGTSPVKTRPPTTPAIRTGSVVATGPTTYAVGASSIRATLHVGFLSWVRVNADGKQALWKEEPGHFTTTFAARHTLAIYLGYPAGSTITVNGHTIGPLATKNPEWLTFDTRTAGTGK